MSNKEEYINDLKLYLKEFLSFEYVQKLNEEEFRDFVFQFFQKFEKAKQLGAKDYDFNQTIMDCFNNSYCDDDGVLYRRMEALVDETTNFFPKQNFYFWDMEFNEYWATWEKHQFKWCQFGLHDK